MNVASILGLRVASRMLAYAAAKAGIIGFTKTVAKETARFGVTVVRDGWSRFVIPAGSRYRNPEVVNVEGDAGRAASVASTTPVRSLATRSPSATSSIPT